MENNFHWYHKEVMLYGDFLFFLMLCQHLVQSSLFYSALAMCDEVQALF